MQCVFISVTLPLMSSLLPTTANISPLHDHMIMHAALAVISEHRLLLPTVFAVELSPLLTSAPKTAVPCTLFTTVPGLGFHSTALGVLGSTLSLPSTPYLYGCLRDTFVQLATDLYLRDVLRVACQFDFS